VPGVLQSPIKSVQPSVTRINDCTPPAAYRPSQCIKRSPTIECPINLSSYCTTTFSLSFSPIHLYNMLNSIVERTVTQHALSANRGRQHSPICTCYWRKNRFLALGFFSSLVSNRLKLRRCCQKSRYPRPSIKVVSK